MARHQVAFRLTLSRFEGILGSNMSHAESRVRDKCDWPGAASRARYELLSSSSSQTTTSVIMTISVAGDTSDDDLDWEEVYVPEPPQHLDVPLELELESPPAPQQNIEITLQTRPKKNDSK